MTFFAVCILLVVANVLAYKDAAMLLPVTGALLLAAGVRLFLQPHTANRPGRPRETAGKAESVQVRRVGKVLYASFPSTKEGRQQAIKAFSEEAKVRDKRPDQPLQ
jgi:hypothetical protein